MTVNVVGRPADTCEGDFTGCIVERRLARFVPHTNVVVPVLLSEVRGGVRCEEQSLLSGRLPRFRSVTELELLCPDGQSPVVAAPCPGKDLVEALHCPGRECRGGKRLEWHQVRSASRFVRWWSIFQERLNANSADAFKQPFLCVDATGVLVQRMVETRPDWTRSVPSERSRAGETRSPAPLARAAEAMRAPSRTRC